MATPRVFVSMGTPYKPELIEFRDALESLLRDRCGVDPRIMLKNEYPSGSPLEKIAETIRTCDGVIVVANERKFVESGFEKRGSSNEHLLKEARYTTAWNHIESALAYAYGVPLYIISEKGLRAEGLIESKADWYVLELEFNTNSLHDPLVLDSLRAWIDHRVKTKSSQPKPHKIELLSVRVADFTVHDWIVISALAVGLMLAGAALEHAFPGMLDVIGHIRA